MCHRTGEKQDGDEAELGWFGAGVGDVSLTRSGLVAHV